MSIFLKLKLSSSPGIAGGLLAYTNKMQMHGIYAAHLHFGCGIGHRSSHRVKDFLDKLNVFDDQRNTREHQR